jgi:hypothetical protein
LDLLAAAGLISAATGAGVHRPRSGTLHTFRDDRPRDALADRLPLAAADVDVFGLGAGTADRVTDVAIARLRHDMTGRVALVAPASLSDRPTDGVANVTMASLIARLADGVALVAPARLHARAADGVALVAITCLVAGDANGANFVTPAGLSDRPADGKALITVAGFVAGLRAADRHLFADLIINGVAADFLAAIPDDFLDRLVAGGATLLGGTHVATGRAGRCRTAGIAGRAAVSRFGDTSARQQQEQNERAEPRQTLHRSDSSD